MTLYKSLIQSDEHSIDISKRSLLKLYIYSISRTRNIKIYHIDRYLSVGVNAFVN